MKSKQTTSLFGTFGLNTYEAKSYLSLLEKQNLTAVEVSKIAGIPRARVYETLENLMTKGFCHSISGKVKKYRAVNPIVFREKIENELEAVKNEIEQKKQELSSMKKTTDEIIEELVPIYEKSRTNKDPLEYIEIIKNLLQIHKKFMYLVDNAKQEILIFDKPPYSGPPEKLDEQHNQQFDLLKKGLRIKTIYEIPTDEEEKKCRFKTIDLAVKHGEEAKVIKKLPLKMAIFDSKIIMYVLADPISKQTSLTTQIIEHRDLAISLKITFKTLWKQAEDYHILIS